MLPGSNIDLGIRAKLFGIVFREIKNICNFASLSQKQELSLGVMVAHLILVQLVRVRVLEGQLLLIKTRCFAAGFFYFRNSKECD